MNLLWDLLYIPIKPTFGIGTSGSKIPVVASWYAAKSTNTRAGFTKVLRLSLDLGLVRDLNLRLLP